MCAQDDGEWVASQANFTSLATPNAIGSGKTALNTLLHEGKLHRTPCECYQTCCNACICVLLPCWQ